MIDDNSNTDNFCDDDLFDALDAMNNTEVKKNKHICINCSSNNITKDHSKGCMRCIDCNVCFGQIFDDKPEWSVYEDGKNEGSARCGQPTSFFFPKSSSNGQLPMQFLHEGVLRIETLCT